MKKSIIICLFLGLISCNNQQKKVVDKEQTTIESKIVIEDVSVEQFQKLIAEEGTQLVDVRTPKEFEEGHIDNALLINFLDEDFNEQSLQTLDKNKPVYLYCRSGVRSAKAAAAYQEAGFTKVYNLLGGYSAWSKEK